MKFFFIMFLLLSLKLQAQHQERQVLVYNIALGGITTGIGAVII